jgi:exopolysaccharide biosynthesis polyprenyl glycosylphosphotransferase
MMRMGAQTILVADVLKRDSVTMHALSLAVESLGIELAVSVSVADIGGHRVYLRNVTQQQILTASLPQYSAPIRVVKRLIDILGSFVALLFSLPLVMIPVALAIKFEDGGPVLYKQERIGQNGVPFDCYKFRSMVLNADELDAKLAQQSGQEYGALFKVKDDPRVTKVGRIIRKFSLDEFPQFFNVLKGDMSLVGPRPQRLYEVEQYSTLYSTRLLVKPGITGPWQISGRSNLSIEEAERLDVSYIENWSLTGDLVILMKTVLAVVRAVGSY